jgi:hypothetical protein
MKTRSRQDRDVQGDGKADHPFENDEFGVDPGKAVFVVGKRFGGLAAPSGIRAAASNPAAASAGSAAELTRSPSIAALFRWTPGSSPGMTVNIDCQT